MENTKRTVKVEVVSGAQGAGLYVNDCRVAGRKPMGGGVSTHCWHVEVDKLRSAVADATIAALQAELAALRKATEPQPWPQVKVEICNIEPSAPFICHADRFLRAQVIEELEGLLREDPPMHLPAAERIIATITRFPEDQAAGEPEHWEFVNFYEVPMPPAPAAKDSLTTETREEGRG